MGEDLPRSHSMTLESQDKGSGRVQARKPRFESRSALSHLTSLRRNFLLRPRE